MRAIKKWLQEDQLEFEEWTLTDESKAILVKTDYKGMYPPRESLNKIYKIENKIKRFKKLETQIRGFYQGVLIKEIKKA